MPKLSFRESMVNMLGEFVALNKNPEFRLSPKSSQFIDEAMKNEYERSRTDNIHTLQIMFDVIPFTLRALLIRLILQELDINEIEHKRSNSTNSKSTPNYRPMIDLDRRQSVPNTHKRPSLVRQVQIQEDS